MQTELAEIWELEVAFLLKQATPDGCLVVVCGWLPCSCSPVALFLVPAMLGCFRDSDLVPPFLCNTHLPALSHVIFRFELDPDGLTFGPGNPTARIYDVDIISPLSAAVTSGGIIDVVPVMGFNQQRHLFSQHVTRRII
jgi:hypothetical protein